MFDRLDWLGIPLYLGIPLGLLLMGNPSNPDDRSFYRQLRTKIPLAPRAEAFAVAWIILYPLVGFSGLLFWHGFEASELYTAALVLWWVNLFLNSMWYRVFFGMQLIGWSLLLIIPIALTSLGALALFGVAGAWLPFGLYAAYVLWMAFAVYLNSMAWVRPIRRNEREATTLPQPQLTGQLRPLGDDPAGHRAAQSIPGGGGAVNRGRGPMPQTPGGSSKNTIPMGWTAVDRGAWSRTEQPQKTPSFVVGDLQLP